MEKMTSLLLLVPSTCHTKERKQHLRGVGFEPPPPPPPPNILLQSASEASDGKWNIKWNIARENQALQEGTKLLGKPGPSPSDFFFLADWNFFVVYKGSQLSLQYSQVQPANFLHPSPNENACAMIGKRGKYNFMESTYFRTWCKIDYKHINYFSNSYLRSEILRPP